MKYKLLIIIVIILNTINNLVKADFWGGLADVGECILEGVECLCNIGCDKRTEKWGGKYDNKRNKRFETWCNCPPYEKHTDRQGCLLKFEAPKAFLQSWDGFYYHENCAEKSPTSTFKKPKIRVRMQACNAAVCWTKKADLVGFGECVLWPTGYAIPLARYCARFAIPGILDEETGVYDSSTEDHGYTKGFTLNEVGEGQKDPEYKDRDGKKFEIHRPKICAYDDPSLIQVEQTTFKGKYPDLFDWDPTFQPLHKGEGLHPIMKFIILLIDLKVTKYDLIHKIIMSFFPDLEDSIIDDIMEFMLEVLNLVADYAKDVLKEIGQINAFVDSSLGCVEIPMGPYPPPFCKKTGRQYPSPSIYKICPRLNDGSFVTASSKNKCINSDLEENNSIHNAIRVAFDYPIRKCKDDEDYMKDQCADFSNLNLPISPQYIHEDLKDIIPNCNKSSPPCVNTNIKNEHNKYRAIYGIKSGDKVFSHSLFYKNTIKDCPNETNGICQTIWGVDVGEFKDLVLEFPTVENRYTNDVLTTESTIKDPQGNNREFRAAIVRENDTNWYKQQTTGEICVYETDSGLFMFSGGKKLIDCKDRPPLPKPEVYNCESPEIKTSCESTNRTPAFVTKLSIPNTSYTTEGALKVKSIKNRNKEKKYTINLAGAKYTAFVTDKDYQIIPFHNSQASGPGSLANHENLAPNTLLGTYTVGPLKNNGKWNKKAKYRSGLEYLNGLYSIGGEYICLNTNNIEQCPQNKFNCVKARKDYEGHASRKLRDRIVPSQSQGAIIPDTEYFDPTQENIKALKNTTGIRDKTAIELNLCTDIPKLPGCEAITKASNNSGYATWEAAALDEISTGTCKEGYNNALGELKRRCVYDVDKDVSELEEITSENSCYDDKCVFNVYSNNATITHLTDELIDTGAVQNAYYNNEFYENIITKLYREIYLTYLDKFRCEFINSFQDKYCRSKNGKLYTCSCSCDTDYFWGLKYHFVKFKCKNRDGLRGKNLDSYIRDINVSREGCGPYSTDTAPCDEFLNDDERGIINTVNPQDPKDIVKEGSDAEQTLEILTHLNGDDLKYGTFSIDYTNPDYGEIEHDKEDEKNIFEISVNKADKLSVYLDLHLEHYEPDGTSCEFEIKINNKMVRTIDQYRETNIAKHLNDGTNIVTIKANNCNPFKAIRGTISYICYASN